jgi:hypothetical protein
VEVRGQESDASVIVERVFCFASIILFFIHKLRSHQSIILFIFAIPLGIDPSHQYCGCRGDATCCPGSAVVC